jgi:UDP-N-acetylmuramoylalanine--D-glutamate ligase
MTWLTAFKGKKIVVLGAGMTGLSCLRFLHAQGLSLIVNDSRQMPFTHAEQLSSYQQDYPHCTFYFGQWQHAIIASADIIITSPGIDLDAEGLSIHLAKDCQIIGDIELFCLVNNSLDKPIKVLAITGSNGKSTVVSLLNYLGNTLNYHCVLAGNIGEPILNLLTSVKAELNNSILPDVVIVELSSFQLETLSSMQAIAGSVLNISDDHLDRHKTLKRYKAIKQKIYTQARIAVINRDDTATISHVFNQKVVSFGVNKPEEGHFGLAIVKQKQSIMFGEQKLVATEQLGLVGLHNYLNYMAALALGLCAGWSLPDMVKNLNGFHGLAHRCQRVYSDDNVQWVNDSKATNVGATLAALDGLGPSLSKGKKLILIAGGDSKGGDFSPLTATLNNDVYQLITLGKDGPKLAELVNNSIAVNSLEEAVLQAKTIANAGDMVLLSPACASIDMFKNYQERGDIFIAAVTQKETV